jgi:hypothetical protein
MISPAVHGSLARTPRERCIQEEKEAAVPFTRVPAKEAPRPRVSRTVSKLQTALTGNVPTGPVAVPSKESRQSAAGARGRSASRRPCGLCILDRQSLVGWPRFTAEQTLR